MNQLTQYLMGSMVLSRCRETASAQQGRSLYVNTRQPPVLQLRGHAQALAPAGWCRYIPVIGQPDLSRHGEPGLRTTLFYKAGKNISMSGSGTKSDPLVVSSVGRLRR